MHHCPNCQNDLPPLSKICPVCGFIIEDDTESSADKVINDLEQIVFRFKQLSAPTFASSIKNMLWAVVASLTAYCFIMAHISGWTVFRFAGFILLLTLPYFIGKLIVSRSSDSKEAKTCKLEYEKYEGTAKRQFGVNSVMSRHIDALTAEMLETDEKRNDAVKRIRKIWLISGAAFVIFAASTASIAEWQAYKEAANAEFGAFQKKVSDFIASPDNNEYVGEAVRIALIKGMLAEGKTEYAEKFFFNYCMGRVGDFECACLIATSHISAGHPESAASFIAKTALRYDSDNNKLLKLLK